MLSKSIEIHELMLPYLILVFTVFYWILTVKGRQETE